MAASGREWHAQRHLRAVGKGEPHTLTALACGASAAEAAQAGGVSERTVRRRLAEPAYRRQVAAVRADVLGRIVGQLVDAGTDAL